MLRKVLGIAVVASMFLAAAAPSARASMVEKGVAVIELVEKALNAAEKSVDSKTERTERQLERQRDCKQKTGNYGC